MCIPVRLFLIYWFLYSEAKLTNAMQQRLPVVSLLEFKSSEFWTTFKWLLFNRLAGSSLVRFPPIISSIWCLFLAWAFKLLSDWRFSALNVSWFWLLLIPNFFLNFLPKELAVFVRESLSSFSKLSVIWILLTIFVWSCEEIVTRLSLFMKLFYQKLEI